MKRIIIFAIFIIVLVAIPSMVFAQPMMGSQSAVSFDGHTAREEQEGKAIWDKIQAKQATCDKLSSDDFERLGEYFMGQSIGNTERHAAMNQMMTSMMGEKGEEQMHVAMGKRLSGCDTSTVFPQNRVGFMPMMWMMGGGGNPMMGYGDWGGFGFGWIFMIIFWILIILGIVALVRYLGGAKQSSADKDKTPLDVLKERYAEGEINKKEFEEMKKDIS